MPPVPTAPEKEAARQAAIEQVVFARDVLGEIGREWERLRTKDRIGAWMYLQKALMENMAILVPMTVSLKDLLAAATNIEEMLAGQQGDSGESPSEYLSKWLNETRAGRA